ncbi:MAG: glycosyltransferase family 39 protein [Anaerolineae bacterium]
MADSGLPMAGTGPASPATRLATRPWAPIALAALVLGLAANLALLLPVPLLVRTIAAIVLLALPGVLVAERLLAAERVMWAERVAFAAAMAVAGALVLGLAVAYLPTPMTRAPVLLAFDGATVALAAWLALGQAPARPISIHVRALWWLAVPVALALVFRLTFLGYSEFQGDEARAMLMAAGLGQGRSEILFFHKKAPGEVLTPALVWAATDGIDETSARLPFALMNAAAVLAIGALAWRLFTADSSVSLRAPAKQSLNGGSLRYARDDISLSERTGESTEATDTVEANADSMPVLAAVVAALVLALDGYFVAFARIVQYQSIVALTSIVAVWAAWRYYKSGRGRWAIVAGALVAAGLLGHYEAVFAIPPVAWLLWRRGGLRGLLAPTAVFAAIAAFFYLPFALHPHFRETVFYILNRRVGVGNEADGGGPLYNKLADYFLRATFYNSTWYIVLLAVALVAVFAWLGWRGFRRGRWLALVWPVVALAVVVAAPEAIHIGKYNLSLFLLLPLLLWVLAPRLDDGVKATILWFLGPFLVASFLTQKPHTHFYTMMPGAALLVGLGVAALAQAIQARGGRIARFALPAVGVVVVLLLSGYIWMAFVSHSPEYKRVYPAARSPFYPVVYGDDPPRGGYFGFPYQAGWSIVGSLFADGTLQGDYDSNEEPLVTGWYTRGAVRSAANPRYYIVGQDVQDPVKIPLDRIEKDYHLLAQVNADGDPKLRIYSRDPVAAPREYVLADTSRFNPYLGPSFPVGQALAEAPPAVHTDAMLGSVRLLGYELASPSVKAGEPVGVTLFWQPTAKIDSNLSVFAHVEDGSIRGQSDGWPDAGQSPTSTWLPGDTIIESRSVTIDPTTPPGAYPLRVGLYDSKTLQRLPARGADTDGDHAVLGNITVKP